MYMEDQQQTITTTTPNDYKKLVEAALFVTGKAMNADELAQAVGIASVGSVTNMVNELIAEYERRDSSLAILKIGDKYIMSVREPYSSKVNNLAGAPDLSKGAMRILAYVSKNSPTMQSGIVKSFGSTSYDYLKELTEKEFISSKKVGRTKSIETTEKFREYFNV